MRRLRNITVLIALLTGGLLFARHSAALLAWAQIQATSANRLTSLRIVSPKNGERLEQSSVTVQYAALQVASAAARPQFELLLDAQDPVHTSYNSYTFTGLTTGTHELIVQAVDANHTLIPGTRSEVSFRIVPQTANSTQRPLGSTSAQQAGNQSPPAPNGMAMLPDARTSLPLLSVIGFGILVGGVISALRTRPAANR